MKRRKLSVSDRLNRAAPAADAALIPTFEAVVEVRRVNRGSWAGPAHGWDTTHKGQPE